MGKDLGDRFKWWLGEVAELHGKERHKDISVGVTFPVKGKREDSRTFGKVVLSENKRTFLPLKLQLL